MIQTYSFTYSPAQDIDAGSFTVNFGSILNSGAVLHSVIARGTFRDLVALTSNEECDLVVQMSGLSVNNVPAVTPVGGGSAGQVAPLLCGYEQVFFGDNLLFALPLPLTIQFQGFRRTVGVLPANYQFSFSLVLQLSILDIGDVSKFAFLK